MTLRKTPPIPAPYPDAFIGTIQHPKLLLWDSWVMNMDGVDHLYCLALARRDHDGCPITPEQCNDYKFHFRHFESTDRGASWTDKGAVLKPGNITDGNDSGNLWSGGVLPLEDGRVLFGFTGIADESPQHQFVQSINFAIGTTNGPEHFAVSAASHPVRDRKAITEMGYYLPEADQIGSIDGEDNGPITAWRDPYFYKTSEGEIFAFWSAKLGPRRPAVAWGKISVKGNQVAMELLPPISIPDDTEYTQSEVPKICKNTVDGTYYMMISACNRVDEKQADDEIIKQLRLYKSQNLKGPWETYQPDTSVLKNLDNLFGASFLDANFGSGEINLIAPYTVKAGPNLELSFASMKSITF